MNIQVWILTNAPIVALVFSFLAVLLSAFALAWNIARDLFLKARLKVSIGIKVITHAGRNSPPFVEVRGVNHGPGVLPCHMIVGERRNWFGKLKERFVILEDHVHMGTTKLPDRTLQIGGEVSYCVNLSDASFLTELPLATRVGISDRFGRIHWASRKNLKEVFASARKYVSEKKKPNK